MMRSTEEQVDALMHLIRVAGKLHRVNLQLAHQPGDVVEVTGHTHAENVSVVYPLADSGYDLWVDGHHSKADLTLYQAAEAIADAYMEAKLRFVITHTWGMEPLVAESILADPKERRWFFKEMDKGSDLTRSKIEKRHTN